MSINMTTWRDSLQHVENIDLTTFEDSAAGLLPTAAMQTIVYRVSTARKMHVPLALVTGSHGVGKTTSLREYASIENLLMWEARPGYQAKHVLSDIAERMGLSAGQGWRMQTSIVAEQLRAHPRTMIIDEAQRLNYDGFDLLKYLADASSSTFVLSASPSLEKRIDRWQDIASRCPVRVRVAPMTAQEFVDLQADSGFSREALIAVHECSAGILRRAQWLMHHLDEAIDANKREQSDITRASVAAQHVRALASEVLA